MSLPAIIYKYRKYTDLYHKRLLFNRELFAASPKDLNDPFDTKIYPNYINRNNQEIRDYALTKGIRLNDERHIEKFKDEFQHLTNKNYYEYFNDHMGIISFSLKWDNKLLWSHYSEDHKGFCVGLKTTNLYHELPGYAGGRVKYSDSFPDINPFAPTNNKATDRVFTKSKEWEYEDEFRLAALQESPYTKESRIIKFSTSMIAEVILGLSMPDNHKAELINHCKICKIKVYQINQIMGAFNIKRELIYTP